MACPESSLRTESGASAAPSTVAVMQCVEQMAPRIRLEGSDHPREVEDLVTPLQRCVELSCVSLPGRGR